MQTFLPYENFAETAKCLDNKRLGKQRVEAMQIMQTLLSSSTKKGWKNHPAVKMWKGYEPTLMSYQTAICAEWQKRGYKDTCYQKTYSLFCEHSTLFRFAHKFPSFLGNEEFHASHRSNLLRKKLEHYSQFGWKESHDLQYVWPVI